MPTQSLNPHWIYVNIPIDNQRALLGIVKDRFETPLKEWSSPPVQAVVPTAEGEVEPLDGSAQVGLQGFNLQMIMISISTNA
jgi:hypothetical protein